MTPTLSLSNVLTTVEGADRATERRLWKALSFKVEGAEFSPLYARGFWDGYRHLFSMKQKQFPTGLLSWALPCFEGTPPAIIDERIRPKRTFEPRGIADVTLREYQSAAVAQALKAGRGVIRIATGGGKSKVLAEIAGRLGVPTLICVHLTPLLYQLQAEISESLPGIDVGIIGDSKFAPRTITVAMIQSLHAKRKYPQMRTFMKSIGCALFDECHHIAADTVYDLSEAASNAFYRFGVSATPWRSDKKDLLIHAATGRRIVDVSASTLIQQGFLSKPKVYLFNVPEVRGIAALTYNSAYKTAIVENSVRNNLIAQISKKIVTSGKRVLVAVNQVTHGKNLLPLIQKAVPDATQVAFIRGENESEEKTRALRDLNSGKLRCVIATTVFGEGVDVPNLDALINAKGNLSPVETLQVAGRALRRTDTKNSAMIVDFLDQSKFFLTHSRKRVKTYFGEPEFEIFEVWLGKPIRLKNAAQLQKPRT